MVIAVLPHDPTKIKDKNKKDNKKAFENNKVIRNAMNLAGYLQDHDYGGEVLEVWVWGGGDNFFHAEPDKGKTVCYGTRMVNGIEVKNCV